MDEILDELAKKYGNEKWINSYVSKGPIIFTWQQHEPWIIVDQKTEDYHFVHYRNRYILTGGNWREREDANPSAVFRRQIHEELSGLANLLLDVEPEPFAEYLEFDKLSDHGDEGLRTVLTVTNGDIYAIVSVFGLTLEGERVQEYLKIPSNELNPLSLQRKIISDEARTDVLTLQDLRSERYFNNFGAGDGEKLRDYFEAHDILLPSISISRGTNYKLKSHPLTPYAERDTLRYLRVNPLERDTRNPQSSFKRI